MKFKLFINFIAFFLCSSFVIPNIALAHSGGTDEDGCHRESRTGTRHCHNSGSHGSSSTGWIIGGAAVGVLTLFFLTRRSGNSTKKSRRAKKKGGSGVNFIDLELNSATSNHNPVLGEKITLTLSIFNNSYLTANDIEVSSKMPEGLKIISFDADQESYNSSTGIWKLKSLASQTTKELYINAIVEANDINLTSEVISADEIDRDSTPNNNRPSEDDQSYLEINNSKIDFSELELPNKTEFKISSIPDFGTRLEDIKNINGTDLYVDSLKIQHDEYYLELKYKF